MTRSRRCEWWKAFGDAKLDELEGQALAQSPTLTIAAARLSQARATLGIATLATPSAGIRGHARPTPAYHREPAAQQLQLAQLLDGPERFRRRVGRELRSRSCRARLPQPSRARAHPRSAPPRTSRIRASSLRPISPPRYYNSRELDIELDVLRRSIALQRRALETRGLRVTTSGLRRASTLRSSRRSSIARSRRLTSSPSNARSSNMRSQRSWELRHRSSRSRRKRVRWLRRQFRSVFRLTCSSVVPMSRQRRGAMAAANAQIGVARSALYPSTSWARASATRAVTSLRSFPAPSAIWTLGGALTQPIFDGGPHPLADRFRAGGV